MISDPIEMLKNDHVRLRSIFQSMQNRDAGQREDLVRDLEREIKIHSLLEEEIFYPAFRDAAGSISDRQMYFEATEEHHVVDMVVPELKAISGDSERFVARAKVVQELVEHHIEEEENEMFPKAVELLGGQRMRELGSRMISRRVELEREWNHPVTRVAHKAKSLADKFMPASLKDRDEETRRPR
jgi:hemerythrin-like domain-containing protein